MNSAKCMDAFLQERLDSYIEELKTLCAQPSISAKNEGIAECADLVARLLEKRGVAVQILPTPGSPVVIGHVRGRSSRTLLLYNHYDVQPPEPLDLWNSPPFEPTLRHGKLYARGVCDDKGEIVARLAAIDAVRHIHDGALPCGLTFVIEGEEEVGSPHIAQFVQDHLGLLACDGSIWEGGGVTPDGHPSNVLGYRGVLTMELFLKAMTRDAHSGGAHILPNAAWRLVRLLTLLKGPDEQIPIPGFYDAVRPPSSQALAMLEALPTYEELYRSQYGVEEFVLNRTGQELAHAVFQPTCNIQGFSSGYQGRGTKTIIPAEASVKLDFRLVPDQEPDEIQAKLRTYLDDSGFADVEIARHGAMGPAMTALDDPFVELTSRTGQEVYGKPARIAPLGGGSSPVYAFAGPLGDIPVVAAGIGYYDSRGHAPNENIRIADFLTGARHIARIVNGFGDLPDGS